MARKPAAGKTATDEVRENRPPRLVSSRVIHLATLLRRTASLAYKREFDLASSEWRILVLTGEFAPLSHGELTELASLDKGQLSRGVTALVDRGLLMRTRNRRQAQIELSHEGRVLFDRIMLLAEERNRQLVRGIPEADVEVFFRTVEQMMRTAKELFRAEQGR
ncbi:MAG: MarR family transcriptional regulator [Alphaproteobacteria bacterium]|jgi:DNA-binding MarR family transcriptional regulator|nr:MarR family transcriptional regulator [Alphaproteobacteria bacterium]